MRGLAVATGLALAVACNAIVARPLSSAPQNDCTTNPCPAYEADAGPLAPKCVSGQCIVPTAANRPDYPFQVVVNLPDSSFFAPGLSWVFDADASGGPAFKKPSQANPLCTPPQCLQIGGDASLVGRYVASAGATATVKATLDATTAAPIKALTMDQGIPVRVMFTPTGNAQRATFPTLPLQPLVASSGTNLDPAVTSTNDFGRTLLAGTYTRELYPEPPFDAIYPPLSSTITFTAGTVRNDFNLVVPQPGQPVATQSLDFSTNQCTVNGTQQDARCAVVTRDDGLDGWRVWIEDATTRKRVSVVRTFANLLVDGKVSVVTQGAALLYTAGGGGTGTTTFNAVVAPTASSLGVPRLETPLFGGTQGLQTLVVPTFPPPVTVRGVVAEPGDGAALLGYAAEVTLTSTTLTTATGTSPLLHYATTVSTDDRGRFATVLPPGSYTATVDPATGTRFARSTFDVVVDRTITALTLQPAPRSTLRGRALLTDGRPVAEAAVLLDPRETTDAATGRTVLGRPAQTAVAGDGAYAIDLDPGTYVLSVIPKEGTGFPRVVRRITIGTEAVTAPDVRIPPPIHLSFNLRDPNQTGNPIVRAVVRIFAALPGEAAPVEIGNGMTDTQGLVEILLASAPQ